MISQNCGNTTECPEQLHALVVLEDALGLLVGQENDNLTVVVNTIAVNESESEIVRIRLLALTQSALHKYATKFKVDGVTQKEITDLYKTVSDSINSITTTTENTEEEKNVILSLLPPMILNSMLIQAVKK